MSADPAGGGYRVILADPPWRFKTHSSKGLGRSADAWYDTMTVEDIKALPVAEQAAPDCVLFLWTTDPFLPIALDVIRAWGFNYSTIGFVWAKTAEPQKEIARTILAQSTLIDDVENLARRAWNAIKWPIGTGYWTRANPELCLLAKRGSPKRKDAGVRKLIIAPRREHSRKPDETYERIERLVEGPYLELFARQRRPGWDAWGLEADSGPRAVRRWGSGQGPSQEIRE